MYELVEIYIGGESTRKEPERTARRQENRDREKAKSDRKSKFTINTNGGHLTRAAYEVTKKPIPKAARSGRNNFCFVHLPLARQGPLGSPRERRLRYPRFGGIEYHILHFTCDPTRTRQPRLPLHLSLLSPRRERGPLVGPAIPYKNRWGPSAAYTAQPPRHRESHER